jgi:muramidase (phage lysozyme)
MARLPTADVLGGLPSADSGRVAASGADGSAIARGIEAIGQTVTRIGAEVKRDEDQLDLARARSEFITSKIKRDSELPDDNKPEDLQTRYQNDVRTFQTSAASKIRNPRLREQFVLSTNDDITRGEVAANKRAQTIQIDAEKSDIEKKLDELRNAALKTTDEAEKTKVIQTGADLISGLENRGLITKQAAYQARKKWVEDYQIAQLEILPPEDRVKKLSAAAPQSKTQMQGTPYELAILNTIAGTESAGNYNIMYSPDQKNQRFFSSFADHPRSPAVIAAGPNRGRTSDAAGKYQFLSSTWDATVREYNQQNPDDPIKDFSPRNQDRAAFFLAAKTYKRNKGRDLAEDLLSTDGNVIAGIGHALRGEWTSLPGGIEQGQNKDRFVTSFLNHVRNNGGPADHKISNATGNITGIEFLPEDKRVKLLKVAQTEVLRNQTQTAANRGEEVERLLLDIRAGKQPIFGREEIEKDPLLNEPQRNRLLREYDSTATSYNDFANAMTRFTTGGQFNPFEKSDRDSVDKIYNHLGANPAALQSVVDKTGILPSSVATQIRGDLVSGNAERVETALNRANNLVAAHPTIFTKVDGGSTIQDAALEFRHNIDNLGMTAKDAIAKYIESQTPEYQAKVRARIKGEDINDIVKKNLKPEDVTSAFNQNWTRFGRPQLEFSPEAKGSMFSDYVELFKDKYNENGDIGKSKVLATEQLKRVWGVTGISGTDTLMRYPPEKSPRLQGIENVSQSIADQALASIKEMTGQDVDRKSLRIMSIPTITSTAFKSGEPVPYMLTWSDKNGEIHMLPRGKGFVVDDTKLRKATTQQRAEEFPMLQEAADVLKLTPHVPGLPQQVAKGAVAQGVSAAQMVRKKAEDLKFIPSKNPSELVGEGLRAIQKKLRKKDGFEP